MSPKAGIQKLFPSFFYVKKLGLQPQLIKALEGTALQLPSVDLAGVKWSKANYRYGYTSYGSMSQLYLQATVFETLKEKIDREVKKFCEAAGIQSQNKELQMDTMWVNVMNKNAYHAFHRHPDSVVSGTYYVNCPAGSGPFRIEDPRAGLFMNTPERKIQLDIPAKADQLVLFESWLLHEVPPHQGAKPRISISFNYGWC